MRRQHMKAPAPSIMHRYAPWFLVIAGTLVIASPVCSDGLARAQSINASKSATDLSIEFGPPDQSVTLRLGTSRDAVLAALKDCCSVLGKDVDSNVVVRKGSYTTGDTISEVYGTIDFKDGRLVHLVKNWCCAAMPGVPSLVTD